MEQTELIRRYALKKMRELKIFVSMLEQHEDLALRRLEGAEGEKVIASIVDFTMAQLGYPAEVPIIDTPPVATAT